METDIVIGIDIGGTFTKYGLVNRMGEVMGENAMPTKSEEPIDSFLERLQSNLDGLINEIGTTAIKGIGIGAPNANFYSGNIEKAPNLGWKGIVPLRKLIQDIYDLPVFITNDANAAAIGEMRYGIAQNMQNFVMITLGTGLGSGIVVNGQLVYGADGFAGEIGHTLVHGRHRIGGFGRRGVLESYVSVTGLKRTAFKMMADMVEPSELRDISFNHLTGVMVTQAALRGDPVAIATYEYTGMILGEALANTVAHLSPEAIILFGGLTKAGKYLLEPAQKHLEINLLPIYQNKIKLILSGLQDKNVAVLGAASLVWEELDKLEKKTKY